jgi:hypothetical protein
MVAQVPSEFNINRLPGIALVLEAQFELLKERLLATN